MNAPGTYLLWYAFVFVFVVGGLIALAFNLIARGFAKLINNKVKK